MKSNRIKVFVALDYYLPGYRGGGPTRTLSNLVASLGHCIEFLIFTRNHDVAEPTPYYGIQSDGWNQVGNARVFYSSPNRLSFATIRRVIHETQPEIIYLNSFFSPLAIRCLLLRWIHALPRIPVIVAPRGEFSLGALQLKPLKKLLYRMVVRATGLYRRVIWQASTHMEQSDIVREFGPAAKVCIAPNIGSSSASARGEAARKPKTPGRVRLTFLSRISPKKNLEYALTCLREVTGHVDFDIYGPKESESYWRHCLGAIEKLPDNVRANYGGPIEPSEVAELLAGYDFFVFPTLGENFGHVIFEALSAGCPVITSDQTPWRDLEANNAGWTLPLSDPKAWIRVFQRCVDMEHEERAMRSSAAIHLAERIASDEAVVEQNFALFHNALRERQAA